MTLDPRVQEILNLRRSVPVALSTEVERDLSKPAITAQSIPALPLTQAQSQPSATVPEVIKMSSAIAASSGMPETSLLPPVVRSTDDVVADWLNNLLPELTKKIQAIATVEEGGGFGEVWSDLQKLIKFASLKLRDNLEIVQGTEAKALIVSTVLVLFNQYAAPKMNPMQAIMVRSALPFLTQMVYDQSVRLLKKK